MLKRFISIFLFSILSISIFGYSGSIPSGLPNVFGFGAIDKQDQYSPDQPSRWKADQGSACWDYSYQYVVPGWGDNWGYGSYDGAWARNELTYWEARGQIQVFTYYYSYGATSYFTDTGKMTDYWSDLKLLFQVIAANTSKQVIVHFEPDGIGFWMQAGKTATSPNTVKVGSCSSVDSALAGLPDTLQGWHAGIMALRDKYAPGKALVAHHFTHWATGTDLFKVDTNSNSQAKVDSEVAEMTGLMNSIFNGKTPDLFFIDPSDRDAAWYDAFGSGGRWNDDVWTFTATTRSWGRIGYICDRVSEDLGLRGMFWQMPTGNEFYTTCNNSDGHYKDDTSQEAFFRTTGSAPGDAYSPSDTSKGPAFWAGKGIIGCLFGSGYYGEKPPGGDNLTHLRDYKKDGTTGNGAYADDDGGYIRQGVAAYCSAGKVSLNGSAQPTDTPGGPTATETDTPLPTPTFTATEIVANILIYDGDTAGHELADGTASAGGTGTMTENTTAGLTGEGLELVYTNPAYWQEHGWTLPAPLNKADHTDLVFDIRSDTGFPSQMMVLISWSGSQQDINNYIPGGISPSWATVRIPLTSLMGLDVMINEILFISNWNDDYTVYVDNIRIEGGSMPTATPNVTDTFTRTPTATNTNTFTGTNTPTETDTLIPSTQTFTSTQTPVPPTETETETETNVPDTHTFTPTETNTDIPTDTSTPTETNTPVDTDTPIPGATDTNTPTETNTPVDTDTPIPGATDTNTPTETNTPVDTDTPIPGATDTETPTQTNTAVNTNTATDTVTNTPTDSITNTPTDTPTGPPPPTWTFTDTPTVTQTPTATLGISITGMIPSSFNAATDTSVTINFDNSRGISSLDIELQDFFGGVLQSSTLPSSSFSAGSNSIIVPLNNSITGLDIGSLATSGYRIILNATDGVDNATSPISIVNITAAAPSVTETETVAGASTSTPTETETATDVLTLTPTETQTTVGAFTPTPTQTDVPTVEEGDTIEITDILPFPNPGNPDEGLNMKFKISKSVSKITLKVYTSSFRLIRRVEINGAGSYPGINYMQVPGKYFKNLAKGIYYYVLIAEDMDGNEDTSSIDKIIIMR